MSSSSPDSGVVVGFVSLIGYFLLLTCIYGLVVQGKVQQVEGLQLDAFQSLDNLTIFGICLLIQYPIQLSYR